MKSKTTTSYSRTMQWMFGMAFMLGLFCTTNVSAQQDSIPRTTLGFPLSIDSMSNTTVVGDTSSIAHSIVTFTFVSRAQFVAMDSLGQVDVLQNLNHPYIILDLINYTDQDPNDPTLFFLTVADFMNDPIAMQQIILNHPEKYIVTHS